MNNEQHPTEKERREIKREEKLNRRENETNKESKKRIFLWTSVIAAIVAVVLGITLLVQTENSSLDNGNVTVPIVDSVTPNDWIRGNINASTTLIEYSDFECPACSLFHPYVKQIEEENRENIRIIYRHFPLSQHVNGRLAARAAEASGKQGKFWEMHDLLFENQENWEGRRNAKEIFTDYARSLNLDIPQFENDLNSKDINDKINNHVQSGLKYKVNSTPTFFLNDTKLSPTSFEEFRQTILNEINSKS